MTLKGLLRNVNLLNILLIAGGLVFTHFTLVPLTETDSRYLPAAVKSKGEEKKVEEATPPQTLSPNDYSVIGDQNLFHPDRKIPPEKKEIPPLPMPEFILFGTLVTPDLSLAYLEDKKAPVSTPGRGTRQTALKKGETLSGFTLKEIMADKVVMARGDDILTVLLTDPKAPKSREGAGTAGTAKPPTVGAPAPAARPATPSAAIAPRPGVAQPFSPGRPQMAQPPQTSAPPSMTSGPPMPGGVSPKDVIAPQRPRYRTVPVAPAGPYP